MSKIEESKAKRQRFLQAVYEESSGSPSNPVRQQALSERIGINPFDNWDEFSELADYHRQAGNLDVHQMMYGTITITLKGIQEAEKHMQRESRGEQRRRFLRAVYDLADASTNEFVYWPDVAASLGWDDANDEQLEKALAIADYLAESGLLRIETGEGSIYRITAAGIDAVESHDPQWMPSPINDIVVDTPIMPTEPEIKSVVPSQIEDSLRRFEADYPNPTSVAFIMMQFNDTKAHREISTAIKETLLEHGITGVRADEKEYHEDLYPNVRTYMHGCGLGIAVFERIESNDFNPNVSLELGYMYAMQKPVCLLKDRTLHALHTDLVGKLYRQFNFQNPGESIPPVLSKWLSDRELA